MLDSQGARFMLIAGFFFSLMQIGVKYLSHIPAVEIVFFRSVVALFLSVAILKRSNIPLFGKNKLWLVLRGLSGATALILFFITLQRMPLASAVTFQYLSPIFTAILGVFIVKEKVYKWQYLFFLIAFAGVVVVKGFDARISLEDAGIAVLSAFFSGLAYNIIRKIKTSEHPLVIVLYFPLVTLPIAGLISIPQWINPQGWDWLIIIGVGVATQIAQYYMTRSYQMEELSTVAILKYVGIIYAIVFGIILFDESIPVQSYMGIALLFLGMYLNIRFKSSKTFS
jgi:drug/metabolite transporter (DMT)-like permease